MKKVEAPYTEVGVIVGRFQVNKLHDAHVDLIQSVCNAHKKVIIFLGLAHTRGTINNPLDFEARKQMILDAFPQVVVLYIKDQKEDLDWSKDLDEKIRDVIGPTQTVTLYGSRDSFINYYHGKFNTIELLQESYISGTEIRKNIAKEVKNNADFRTGAIWQAFNRYPACYPTVDIAIFNEDETQLLLGRKPKETLFRFIGGFAEPKSKSYEDDALREAHEEAGDFEMTPPVYIGSCLIDDWRYRSEVDKIKTIFFKTKRLFGHVRAGDDIAEVRWFDFNNLKDSDIVPEHRALLAMLRRNMDNNQTNK